MKEEMHWFHKYNFRPLEHDVYIIKQDNEKIKWNTQKTVRPQSMISHTPLL